MSQQSTATQFRKLHAADRPLLLPNAWDAGTARLMETAGSKAIATTSAGVAWSHGYPDGDRLPVRLLTLMVANITRVVSIPVSVDIEGGYSTDLAAVEEVVTDLIDAGAVGINIEDGDGSPELLCQKIEKARQASERHGIALFINARTDVYLRSLVVEEQVAEVIRRVELYKSAGADGLFVPGLTDKASIKEIAAIGLPLNVMACPGLPAFTELWELGVQRLSAGSSISQSVYAQAKNLVTAFLESGDSETVTGSCMSYPDINAMMS